MPGDPSGQASTVEQTIASCSSKAKPLDKVVKEIKT